MRSVRAAPTGATSIWRGVGGGAFPRNICRGAGRAGDANSPRCPGVRKPRPRCRQRRFLLLALLCAGLCRAGGAEGPVPGPASSAHAERLYRKAAAALEAAPSNTTAAWQFARACFDRAEFARDNTERAALAERGIAAARAALARDTNTAALPYYLGMNLGQLARTRTLGALPLVREMEDLFQRARRLDERFDAAGPDRNLGLLYLEAPGWPVSIGHRGKARQHLTRAVELAPEHPENWLNLLEARLRWGETNLTPELRRLAELLPRARQRLGGESWSAAWEDWNRRWNLLCQKTGFDPDSPPLR